jgi:hypothetical protein
MEMRKETVEMCVQGPGNTALADHYIKLPGLNTPQHITDTQMSIEKQRLDIKIDCPVGRKVGCPEFG